MSLKRVFEPIRVGAVTLPNRIARAGHGTHLGRGSYNEDIIAYHVARAKGGCGLSVVDSASVHPSSAITLANQSDEVIPGFQALARAVRPHGMRLFHQLYHGGHITPGANGEAGWSASAVPNPVTGAVPLAMSTAQIGEVVEAFAAAAARCREGLLDGVEVHAAHGYLLHQYLSPLTNRRTDGYGGPIENRMRFLHEVLAAVRARVGRDFVVGVRVSASSVPGGLTEADLNHALRQFEADGLIDYVSASLGDYYDIGATVGAMDRPAGYQIESVRRTTDGLGVPRMATGRYRTLEEAEQALREGAADIISMVRAHIADPQIVNKSRAGLAHQVRPCIGCNQGCIGGLVRDGRLGCLVNPAAGRERTWPEDFPGKAASPRRVVVVGGGPAGMEAARGCALAGHRTVLIEASASLGGMVNIARRSPHFHALGDIVDWLEQEIYRLGVEVRLSTVADAEAIEGEGPDAVVLATGAYPAAETAEDAGLAALWRDFPGRVLSPVEVIADPRRELGDTVLVFDNKGHFDAVGVVETLLARGKTVVFATPFANFAPYIQTTLRSSAILRRFAAGAVRILTGHTITGFDGDSCLLQNDAGETVRCVANKVVIATDHAPPTDLQDTIAGRYEVITVGDARGPGDMQTAIRQGTEAARQLSGAQPAR